MIVEFKPFPWIPILILLGITVLWYLHNRQKHLQAIMDYHRRMQVQTILITSKMLLKTFADNIASACKEDTYLPDPSRSVEADRGSVRGVASLFATWYNMAVIPAHDFNPTFGDIVITKTDYVEADDGIYVEFYLGEQRNDVVRHFIPDRALQAFITRTRGFSVYLQQAVNTPPPH